MDYGGVDLTRGKNYSKHDNGVDRTSNENRDQRKQSGTTEALRENDTYKLPETPEEI